MEKITAEEAIRLSISAKEMRDNYEDILTWVFDMIRKNAKEGYTASRLNLAEKTQFFDKHTNENGWNTKIDYWSLIIEKLTEDLKNLGYRITSSNSNDFHIMFS